MINYFYNIISKDDNCDLLSDVLTNIRKEFHLSREKQKSRLTQNSSEDTVFYEYSLEKDHPLKWSVSDDKVILSESKSLGDRYTVCYYSEYGIYKQLTFSKLHTLLKVEYFDMSKSNNPSCVIEPRKYAGGICLLMNTSSSFQSVILYPMPDINDEFILSKVDTEFTDFEVTAYTNEGIVKYLSKQQLGAFEEFVDAMTALKEIETAPESFIEEDDAQLAKKLNPKDFNIKRNLCDLVDISMADDFSVDMYENEDVIETSDALNQTDDVSVLGDIPYIDVDSTLSAFLNEVENTQPDTVSEECVNDQLSESVLTEAENDVVDNEALDVVETVDSNEFDFQSDIPAPDSVIESANNKYNYYGKLDSNGNRVGFGRTATANGYTAYEGDYLNNKRNGKGAFYYKDGSLCYFGDWKDNKREGLGVGVSSFDNSIHVGSFLDNKPVGDGIRVDKDGQLIFLNKTLSNGTRVMIEFDGDKMVVSKFDDNDNKLSENTSNLIYF